jgi:uncharacterized protein
VFFNVSQLLRELTGATRTFAIDEPFVLPFDGAPCARVSGPLTLIRTHRGLLAEAELTGAMSESCSRCLDPAAVLLLLHVEEEYLPTVDPFTGAHLPAPEEPTPFLIDHNHHLDLSEAVRQAAVLAEPMQPLCRPDCAGLCPECGADLNDGACACRCGPVDDRWAALRALDRAVLGQERRRTRE